MQWLGADVPAHMAWPGKVCCSCWCISWNNLDWYVRWKLRTHSTDCTCIIKSSWVTRPGDGQPQLCNRSAAITKCIYFKALVLQDFLDSHHLARVTQLGLVDNTKRTISYHFSVRVRDFLWPVWTLAWSGNHCSGFTPIFACQPITINNFTSNTVTQ